MSDLRDGSELASAVELGRALHAELASTLVGQGPVIEQLLWCLLANGHALLEGLPGVGKTLLIKTLACCLGLSFSRIQCTPDLMPTDITGGAILLASPTPVRAAEFSFQRGPLFAQFLLVDEVNRASPKTQSALLEAMQERTVTVLGESHALPTPFLVMATENPIELEGTYPLPEAQLDRFLLKILIPAPNQSELEQILAATTGAELTPPRLIVNQTQLLQMMRLCREVAVAAPVLQYASRLITASNPKSETAPALVRRAVRYGASVRGGQALLLTAKARALLRGDLQVSFDDVQSVAPMALRHRLILSFAAEAEGLSTDQVVSALLEFVPSRPETVRRAL